ncbi:MAG: DUF1311 domain-containing protein [Nitrosomonadales bacterium]|nr:DUF1311 domain-containing protein [Nitrosomonadales bacterium]
MVRTISAIFLIVISHVTYAEILLPPGVDCSNPDSPQLDQNCAFVFLEKADQQLNDAYKKLLASLDEEGKVKLRASQRAWVVFRDADVDLVVYHYEEGGSLGRSIAAYRSFQLTRQRAKELSARLKSEGSW